MNIAKMSVGLGPAIFAAVVLAPFASARADDTDDYDRLTQPASNVSIGVADASGGSTDRALYGEYNGLREHSTNLLLDLDYVKRDDKTGTWTLIRGRDLGLDTPELNVTMNRQGDWKASVDYEEIVKHSPYTVNTGMTGVGSTTPTINLLATPGTGQDINPELKRKRLGFEVDKWLTPSLQVQVSFKNEDKSGDVLYGKGFACASASAPGCAAGTATTTGFAILPLLQPVNSTTKQIEAKLNYSAGNLFVSGGYYGSFYDNNDSTLTPTVPGVLNNGLGVPHPLSAGLQGILDLPMALWPSNEAHQLYVDGTYLIAPKVRSTFNVSYQHATQDESFGAMGLTGAPPGVGNLDGVMNTAIAQFGVSAQPLPKLSLSGNLRYEDRDDDTPIEYYGIEGAANTASTNTQYSYHKFASKFEGTYQFQTNLRGTLGVGYEAIDRDLPVTTSDIGGVTALREETKEMTYQGQLRRTFSDQFAGSVGLVHSERTGSDWYTAAGAYVPNDGFALTPTSTGAFPAYLMDRIRNAAKLTSEWTPNDRTSLQFIVQQGRDHFNQPAYSGMQSSDATLYSLDGSYALTYRWKMTGFVSYSDQSMQVRQPSMSSYQMAMHDYNTAIGLGLEGKATERFDVGGKVAYLYDLNIYDQTMGPTASAANVNFLNSTGGLPDVVFRQTQITLYGKYTVDKSQAVRVDVTHQVDHYNDWTYGTGSLPFTYADNTTVTMNPDQDITVVMARYIYTFR